MAEALTSLALASALLQLRGAFGALSIRPFRGVYPVAEALASTLVSLMWATVFVGSAMDDVLVSLLSGVWLGLCLLALVVWIDRG